MSGIDRVNGAVDRAIDVINGIGSFFDRVCEVGSYLCAEGKRITSQEGESKVMKGFQIVGLVFQGIFAILSCVTCSETSKRMAMANKNNCSLRELDARISQQGSLGAFQHKNVEVSELVETDDNDNDNPFPENEYVRKGDGYYYDQNSRKEEDAMLAANRKRIMEDKYKNRNDSLNV